MGDQLRSSVTLHQLRIFATIARERSFARAAELLCLSQPAISDQIRQLEASVGVRLLDRSRGKRLVELTEAGRVLLDTCTAVFRALEDGARDLERIKGQKTSPLLVGAGMSFGTHVMPLIHDAFRRAHPEIDLRVVVGFSPELLREVKERKLDLAVLGLQMDDPALVTEPMGHYEIVLVGPPGHRLARKGPAPLRELAKERLFLPDRSIAHRNAIDRLAREAGVQLQVIMEVNSIEAKVQAVLAGLGVTAIPYESVAALLAVGRLALLDVEGFPIRIERFLVYRRGDMTRQAEVFRRYLHDQVSIMGRSLSPDQIPTKLSPSSGRAAPRPQHRASPGPVYRRKGA